MNANNMRELMESINFNEDEYDNEGPAVRFEEIMYEMKDLLDEAFNIIIDQGREIEVSRAHSYWYGHINGNITGDGGSMFNMSDALEFLNDERLDDY